MAGKSWKDSVASKLGGEKSSGPKKEIKHIITSKSANGGHVHIHVHHHPETHPDETHTTKGDDEMLAHMAANAGTPNPGEAADPTMQGAAPMTAAPSPAASPSAAGAPPAGVPGGM
jgi:hypothetical protein